ncbi:hypothetical protein [Mobiluncus curtisii]|uniref:hypothetical protein n=1 Tax=Mobiluncus curtisii TaxID=2051 RepID=UPI00242AA32F|nr:hypothetical protein [Mobiluncus curtisii]
MTPEQLATRWAQIKTELETLKLEEDQIKDQLARLDVGKHQLGAYTVQVQAPRRTLNRHKFAEAFPADQYPTMYSLQLDTKQVKDQVAPTVLNQYMDTAPAPVVVLK